MSELEEKKKKLEPSLPKNLLSVIGLKERERKALKVDGLIVMHQTEKVVIRLVVAPPEKKEKISCLPSNACCL